MPNLNFSVSRKCRASIIRRLLKQMSVGSESAIAPAPLINCVFPGYILDTYVLETLETFRVDFSHIIRKITWARLIHRSCKLSSGSNSSNSRFMLKSVGFSKNSKNVNCFVWTLLKSFYAFVKNSVFSGNSLDTFILELLKAATCSAVRGYVRLSVATWPAMCGYMRGYCWYVGMHKFRYFRRKNGFSVDLDLHLFYLQSVLRK